MTVDCRREIQNCFRVNRSLDSRRQHFYVFQVHNRTGLDLYTLTTNCIHSIMQQQQQNSPLDHKIFGWCRLLAVPVIADTTGSGQCHRVVGWQQIQVNDTVTIPTQSIGQCKSCCCLQQWWHCSPASWASVDGDFFQTLTHGLSGDNDNCVLLHNKCNWNDVWSLMSHTIVIVLIIVVMDDNWCMPTMVALAVAIILGNNRRSIYNTYGLSSLLVLTIFCGIRTCHQLLAYTLQIINWLSPLNTHTCVIAPWQVNENLNKWCGTQTQQCDMPKRKFFHEIAWKDELKGLISPKGTEHQQICRRD